MNTSNGTDSKSSNAISPKHPESQSVTEGRGDGVGSVQPERHSNLNGARADPASFSSPKLAPLETVVISDEEVRSLL